MLPGSAFALFARYLERFPNAQTPSEKLLLIDWLIHQFHVMQGVARMPVGQNVIQGTTAQVRELIESLAGCRQPMSKKAELAQHGSVAR